MRLGWDGGIGVNTDGEVCLCSAVMALDAAGGAGAGGKLMRESNRAAVALVEAALVVEVALVVRAVLAGTRRAKAAASSIAMRCSKAASFSASQVAKSKGAGSGCGMGSCASAGRPAAHSGKGQGSTY